MKAGLVITKRNAYNSTEPTSMARNEEWKISDTSICILGKVERCWKSIYTFFIYKNNIYKRLNFGPKFFQMKNSNLGHGKPGSNKKFISSSSYHFPPFPELTAILMHKLLFSQEFTKTRILWTAKNAKIQKFVTAPSITKDMSRYGYCI